jgi:hypothetical protein
MSANTPMSAIRQAGNGPAQRRFGDRYVIAADRVFDGMQVLEGHTVAVSEDKITAGPNWAPVRARGLHPVRGHVASRLHRSARSPAPRAGPAGRGAAPQAYQGPGDRRPAGAASGGDGRLRLLVAARPILAPRISGPGVRPRPRA